jgi:hypothetical protein
MKEQEVKGNNIELFSDVQKYLNRSTETHKKLNTFQHTNLTHVKQMMMMILATFLLASQSMQMR